MREKNVEKLTYVRMFAIFCQKYRRENIFLSKPSKAVLDMLERIK